MTDRTDRFNPHAAAALRKLGQSLRAFAPTIGQHITDAADRVESSKTRRDPVYLTVLETLTKGWSEGRLVSLVHRSVHSGIDTATLTDETYAPPAEEGMTKTLADAWGIWYSDSDPVEVVLRFTKQVAHRVRETVWHPSRVMTDLPDGGLVWRARIAEPREMFPWIRGWGADTEVLEPAELRQRMAGAVRRAGQ